MSRRHQFANLLEMSGSLAAVLKLRARAPVPWLSILTYHRFPATGGFECDDGVVDVTPEEFERQIACVKRHFNALFVEGGGSGSSHAKAGARRGARSRDA